MDIYDDYEVGRPEPTTLEILNGKENNLKILRVERYDLLRKRANIFSDFSIDRNKKMNILNEIDEKVKILDDTIRKQELWVSNFKQKALNIVFNAMNSDND